MTIDSTMQTSRHTARELSAARVLRMHSRGNEEGPAVPEFQSLDEASHHLYLRGLPGPIRCRVDGSTWDVWQDGRSVLVDASNAP